MSICQLYNIQVFCSRQFSALCNLRWKVEGRDQQKAKVFQGVVSLCESGQLYEVLFICAGIKTEGEAIYVYIRMIWKIQDDVCLVEAEI